MKVSELASSRVGEVAGHGETDKPDCSWLRSGKSYEQALLGLERKGREKRNSPLHPLIEKREGKEVRRVIHSYRLTRARAGASHARARERVTCALPGSGVERQSDTGWRFARPRKVTKRILPVV